MRKERRRERGKRGVEPIVFTFFAANIISFQPHLFQLPFLHVSDDSLLHLLHFFLSFSSSIPSSQYLRRHLYIESDGLKPP